jgi:hypothetical protein
MPAHMNPCKLCQLTKDLQESHYIPRFAYKANRARQLKNQNAVVMTSRGIRQDQRQLKDYVLCADCERRFNEGGEKWVLARIPPDYGEPFVLQDQLIKERPLYREDGLALYAGANITAFDMDKLVYFAASIFWRGGVHEWEIDGQQAPKVDLHEHEEPLRVFLLGQGRFPSDAWITTDVSSHKPALNGVIVPMAMHSLGWNCYWFYICGLGFSLHSGNAVPSGVKQSCSQNTSQRIIKMESVFAERVREYFRTVAKQGQTDQSRAMMLEIEKIRGKDAKPT